MTRHMWVAGSLATVATAVLAASPAGAKTTTDCVVANTRASTSYGALGTAVTASAAGDTLTVRGTCFGTTEVGKNLTISGVQAKGSGPPTLDGNQQGSVLTIDAGAAVTVVNLTITHGSGTYLPTAGQWFGGGVYCSGTLTLAGHTLVTGNAAAYGAGAGIVNDGGNVTLDDASSVSGNTEQANGGGIFNFDGSVTLNDTSSISGNTAYQGGGVENYSDGVGALAVLTLNDASSITGNTAAEGGGVYDPTGTTIARPGSITGNSPDDIYP